MFEELARSPEVAAEEGPILRRRRQYLVVRVDRTDLSKNTLRGFKAFDVFLDRHPEFHEDITFFALLQPSRQDVDEYVEYLAKIRDVVSHINTKHGNTDWMPIDLRIESNIHRAVAAYKHYDVLRREPDLRRHEPDRQGGAARQRARRGDDPVRERRRPRGAGVVRDLDQPVRRGRPGRRPPPGAGDAGRRARRPHPGDQADRARERRRQVALGPAGRHRAQAHGRPAARPSGPGRERRATASPTSTSAARRGWSGVGHKPPVARRAVAEAVVRMAPGERPGDVRRARCPRATPPPSPASRGSWPPSGRPS